MLKRAAESCGQDLKKKRLNQRFRKEYSEKFPCVRPSTKGVYCARCMTCESDFTISHGGMLDVKRHLGSRKDLDYENKPNSASITQFFQTIDTSEQDEMQKRVIRAEALVAGFFVEHNIALSTAGHASQLFKEALSDSEIAKQFKSGRTKTTIVKTLATEAQTAAANRLQNGSFVLGTDGSQEGRDQFFPVVVRYLKNETIATELIAKPTCTEAATGKNIFEVVSRALSSLGVPRQNCLSLVCDNANVMTGKNKGVIANMSICRPQMCTLLVAFATC